MKKMLIVFACVAAFALTNCGNKKEEQEKKEAEIAAAKADSTVAANTALETRRATIKREREELTERRRLAAEEKAKANATYKDAKGKAVYYKSEVMPVFGLGQEELERYIQENVNYPTSAEIERVEGTVLVEFVVGSDGVVRDVEAVETTSDAVKEKLSEEAVRVVSSMPKWTAGTQGGKPVDVRFSLPITFQLEM